MNRVQFNERYKWKYGDYGKFDGLYPFQVVDDDPHSGNITVKWIKTWYGHSRVTASYYSAIDMSPRIYPTFVGFVYEPSF